MIDLYRLKLKIVVLCVFLLLVCLLRSCGGLDGGRGGAVLPGGESVPHSIR